MKVAAFIYWLQKQIEENPSLEQMELDYIDIARRAWYSGLTLKIVDRSDGTKMVAIDGA